MAALKASRTLVKSNPELWAECSDAVSLARHLGTFGEIRITRLEPETAVAWEGEDVRGTVTLEPSGWGTRVVLTAETGLGTVEPAVEPAVPADQPRPRPEEPRASPKEPRASPKEPRARPKEPTTRPKEPAARPNEPRASLDGLSAGREAVDPGRAPRRGLLGRLFGFWRGPAPVELDAPGPAVGPKADRAPEPRTDSTSKPRTDPPPGRKADSTPEPRTDSAPEPAPVQAARAEVAPSEVLIGALESLGQAHRRPFSRG